MRREQIKHMVDRFLGWKLPENFRPDAGISFEPEFNKEYMEKQGKPPMRHEPSGTNLFDATQAEKMVQYMIEDLPPHDGSASDGYHTFDELYDHRITLFIALARLCRRQELTIGEFPGQPFVWRSKKHSDGELCFGTGTQYVLGIGNFEGQQITYHIPVERWDETDFAATLEVAPKWDGHTSADVLERLKSL